MKRAGLFSLILLFISAVASPFPNKEKGILSPVSTQSVALPISEDDLSLTVAFGNYIKKIDNDTGTFATDQVPALTESKESGADLAGNIKGIALHGNFLFATQDDGDLIKVDLTKITESPTAVSITTGALGAVTADPKSGGDDKIYIADTPNGKIQVFNTGDGSLKPFDLKDSAGKPATSVAMTFIKPSGGGGNKVFVTSNEGLVFVMPEGGGAPTTIDIDSAHKANLTAMAPTPDGNFVLVTDATDSTVRVISVLTNSQVDTDGNATNGVTPISLTMNSALAGVTVTTVKNPDDTYAFVSGSAGVSVIDLDISGTTLVLATVLDMSKIDSSDTNKDPIAITGSPGPIVASSVSEGRVYTSNASGTLSLISEKPFVTVSSVPILDSAAASADKLKTGGSFTVIFTSSDAGTYSLKLGGDKSGNGKELTTGSVATANASVTTATIKYSDFSSQFAEGINRLFVFVTDSSGNIGRRAAEITVDTPPAGISINSVGFGNGSLYVNFDRLDAADMDHYNVYAAPSAADTLTATLATASESQPDSGETVTVKVSGLTNGTVYFAAVEAVDKSGNVGARTNLLVSGAAASNTPEETVGLIGSSGEGGGC
ncbi:MAG: hypothetical protein Q7S98_00605, partial [Deltaproteobacteria bacterium]|nr:hypothetical protein [Deltaproteobacteria bacterium]